MPALLEHAARVRDRHRASQAAVCDIVEPWEHGAVVRATRYPTYYDFNLVRVERDPGLSVAELVAVADAALAGLEHRRFEFESLDAAEQRRAAFVAAGFKATRLVWMRHEGELPPGLEIDVHEVPYGATAALRRAWHEEDFAGQEYEHYSRAASEVAMTREVTVLAAHERGRAVGFAQLERLAGATEISQVYVDPDHRGAGRGTALTHAAIAAAGDAEDLYIIADDEDRPKRLYERLGFVPVWWTMDFLRVP
jgi:ribosomal protein S18 acetylase RimI-like enzyme